MTETKLAANEVACLIRILADKRPNSEKVEAIYLFHQTKYNAPSSIQAARGLYEDLKHKRNGQTVPIAVAGWETSICGPGYKDWQEWLKVEQTIVIPPIDSINTNTFTESKALARAAALAGWQNIIVIAPPFHLPRAFITLISVLESPIRVYTHPGEVLEWNVPSVHSQGVEQGTWMSFAEGEIGKIRKYQEKGDLWPFPKVVEYLNDRDSQGEGEKR